LTAVSDIYRRQLSKVPHSGTKLKLQRVVLIKSTVFTMVIDGQRTHKMELHDSMHITNGKIDAKLSCA